MFFLEALGAGPSVRRRRAEAVNEFVDSLGPILSALRGRADPASGELSRAHCHLVVAGGIELITEYLADHDPAELPDLTSVLAEVVRVVVLPNLEPVAPTPRRKKRASPDV
ncbi:hypothetical protein BOO86_06755 [Mycobacterium sp. CBMA 234]|nr:hypothetical protein [Mycolicibacterium sp. CBMA 234]